MMFGHDYAKEEPTGTQRSWLPNSLRSAAARTYFAPRLKVVPVVGPSLSLEASARVAPRQL